MSRVGMYLKMAGVFTICAVGGPLTMQYLTPAPDELFNRFSPELQRHNLENRDRRQREYEDFVAKLKEYSKSDKPIWQAAAEAQERTREGTERKAREGILEEERMRTEMRREMSGGR